MKKLRCRITFKTTEHVPRLKLIIGIVRKEWRGYRFNFVVSSAKILNIE